MPRNRYVVLHHTNIPNPHYDLLFEQAPDSPLTAVRCSDWPPTPTSKFQRIPDHRRIYLEYEGEISNNRGAVKRIAAGTCESKPNQGNSIDLYLDSAISIRIPPPIPGPGNPPET